MYRRRVKMHAEGSAAGGSGHTDKIKGHAETREMTLHFVKGRLHRGRFYCACGPKDEQTQRLHGESVAIADVSCELTNMSHDDIDEKLLVIISKCFAVSRLVTILVG